MAMLDTISKYISDVSVLRRLLFAAASLPGDLPNLWDVAVEFSTRHRGTKCSSITAEEARLLAENLEELDAMAFSMDKQLQKELNNFTITAKKPLGLILISSNKTCTLCNSTLQVRKDRPSSVIIYDHEMGTIPGSHYHKVCSNRSCSFTQSYGYSTVDGHSDVHYDPDWNSLPYFFSSRETVFSMQLLRQFDAQIVIGQMSFKQCADGYNYLHTHLSSSFSEKPTRALL